MPGFGVKIKIGVRLACGCEFTETRPPNVVAPVNGEMRVCGHPEHYPNLYAATYSEPIEVS